MVDGITECYFCHQTIPPFQWRANDTAEVQCKVCGPYRILESAAKELFAGKWHGSLHILSGAIRNQNEAGIRVIVRSLDELGTSVAIPKGPLEQIDRIVLYLLRKTESYEATVELSLDYDYSIAFSKSRN